jgi:hypothetical protein
MHHHRHVQLPRKLLGGGEMIRMSVGIDKIFDAESIVRSQCGVAIDLTQLRIDERRRAGFFAADEI